MIEISKLATAIGIILAVLIIFLWIYMVVQAMLYIYDMLSKTVVDSTYRRNTDISMSGPLGNRSSFPSSPH